MNDFTARPMPDRRLWLPEEEAEALARGTHGDPFSILGVQEREGVHFLRAFLPGALGVDVLDREDGSFRCCLTAMQIPGLFAAWLPHAAPYTLRIRWPGGEQLTEDPYGFGLLLGEMDLYLIGEGTHRRLGQCLGAQPMAIEGVSGVRFAVWAPNARRVSVVGSFNSWDGRRHAMRLRHPAGVWELFIPRIGPGEAYKYEILDAHGALGLRADPVALATETPPRTASVVADTTPFVWHDEEWLARRGSAQAPDRPISVYEVHAASWRKHGGDNGELYRWQELAEHLIPYVLEMGFTHIELLPIMEHPFGGSWGYQPLSQFAPSGRFGTPADFACFVDACHQAGLGVILDWVPAHFPTDPHGLARFDGTALYEYEHPFEGFHQDWDTFIYNLGRREVHGFMLASALHWLRHFHVDALRVDAVASMLYRNYSRNEGEWIPNKYGGHENLEAIDFLRHLNEVVADEAPGAMVIAEESTAWPGVTRPTGEDGLGFAYKWNMGWMHDTLSYIREDPIHRRFHHHVMTFPMVYAFSERYVLPISHDEVVHGKGSLIGKMPGDEWQQFANLRAYLSLMWSQPGKKLLFMGCEFGQWREWSHDRELDWSLLGEPRHAGVRRLLTDLNRLYRAYPALHEGDSEPWGFTWIVSNDETNSVFAWLRVSHAGEPMLVVANLTPIPREGYRLGVPRPGRWEEIFNSDAECYGGSNLGNLGQLHAEDAPLHGQTASLTMTLPPLAVVMLTPAGPA
ncbi:1,4-alpha-glucan branching protein GlgB [Halomonas sp. MCCC 1A17488]|uniref:1,4-alpha-glucan branching enzyme GlgB n=1 Tax=Billgrantia sulfidoxydans TaxID=2733484 RepID=A0ABX7W7X8_9GAMM|nr:MULTISPECIES: 1,4-alpha-glucan branching protein GlgB [Halomonas]MCE8018040.1 1,4-alpha-glucan branching protein GlgB [Halomonas sp. MCCC 1A17488]MCG3241373.1 1,4-alpha-glucan branching protein GlgB [Halomonas sp. MCCC 1A17488]QPP48664.1 1,4-alpha-glucan branching protein GlgB [Halomonas sp. SS10-MC5]QTP56006.1 1,4-alpha-glucan branching protein GlgB [Halomonas sulfidoxydans]